MTFKNFSDCGKWRVYGSENPKILIAGHSHTFAHYMALFKYPQFQENFGVITFSDFDNRTIIDSDYWDYVVEISKGKKIVISWNGNQHNLHFLLTPQATFNVYGLENGFKLPATSISRVKALFNPTFYELELILSRFLDRTELCVLGTPSPKRKKLMEKLINNDISIYEIASGLGIDSDEIEISSDQIRMFMWKITQELTADVARKMGCHFLEVPWEALDQDGMLLERYSSEDLTHANPDYAKIMYEKIIDFYGSING